MAGIDGLLRAGARLALPLLGAALFAGMAGYFAAGLVEERLFLLSVEETGKMAGRGAPPPLPAQKEQGPTLKDFAAGDPFGAAPRSSAATSSKPAEMEVSVSELYELEGIRLAGTLPGISVWIDDGGKQTVHLQGQQVKGYELTEVGEDRVVLRKGGTVVNVLLRYSGHAPSRASAPQLPPPVPALSGREVTAARPGQQGSIPRETVDNLLMNPLDEMKKFRLRPKFDGDRALGVEVQWMDRNSFLESVGVEKGDVIQSVNGLEIRNMGDVVNVINSLMGGSAFDVQVLRGGTPVSLKYNIR
jgi:type II secretion system protein C